MAEIAAFKLEGQKELMARLDALHTTRWGRVVRPAINAALTPINRAAKRNAPKRFGILKKSIGKKVKLYSKNRVVWGAVGVRSGFKTYIAGRNINPRKYAHIVEFGAKPHRIGSRMHPGTPATHFLERALKEAGPASQKALVDSIRKNLEKQATIKA